jgi:hypothetical protein
MADWSFYGRNQDISALRSIVNSSRWFFCRVQGRRRIGKTALLRQLANSDREFRSRLIYIQVPDSDELDVVATFRSALQDSDIPLANEIASSVQNFHTMALAIGTACRAGMIVILDEFQYFTRSSLRVFNSFLQAEIDVLRDTNYGGIFVLGSIQSEMEALLDNKAAPLYGRLTAQRSIDHWDFEDLLDVFTAHEILNPYQWLTLWCFFEGVPKFYRDAYEQGLFSVTSSETFQSELLRRMFLMSSCPLAEEADTWFLREIRGRGVSILNFLAQHPGSTNGELKNVIAVKDDATLGVYLTNLVNSFRLVDKRLPVFSDSNSRNARYYISDNFLQSWLAVSKPARDSARIKPVERAIELSIPRLMTLEGFAFEKLIRHLHIECSRKACGDFELTDINMGFWNRAKDVTRLIEIDVVALNRDTKTVRFGSCKRSASAHTNASLLAFEKNIEAFLLTKEGKRILGWNVQKVCFSPVFSETERNSLKSRGFLSRDLHDYSGFLKKLF